MSDTDATALPSDAPPAAAAAERLAETPRLDGEISDHGEGIKFEPVEESAVDEKLAQIEMAGEEVAMGWKPEAHVPLAPEVRYLHCSRTIHQLVTDRNRSVGIFLLVASVSINASMGLLQTNPPLEPIIPMQTIRYWCLPATFGVLAVLGVFTSLLLIRTRIGLIYEVTKMNVLLGLPSQRVERVNPLSIFYLMHLMVATLGGAAAGLTVGMLVGGATQASTTSVASGVVVGVLYASIFQAIYYITILRATSETRLAAARK
ncbi:MAG: hypothetical protein SFX72_02320 [Isosphaeraceae bacterium]|nr:hypothetical protein [Isosphaeraceae bacterium]